MTRIYEELFIVKPDAPDEEIDAFVQKNGKVMIISSKKTWETASRPDFRSVFECKDLFENPTDQGFIIYEQYPCGHRSPQR